MKLLNKLLFFSNLFLDVHHEVMTFSYNIKYKCLFLYNIYLFKLNFTRWQICFWYFIYVHVKYAIGINNSNILLLSFFLRFFLLLHHHHHLIPFIVDFFRIVFSSCIFFFSLSTKFVSICLAKWTVFVIVALMDYI